MGLLRDAVVLGVIGLAAPAPGMTSVALAQTPQSQCSVLSGIPCHPSFCSIFHRSPCMPYYWPPFGGALRRTIVSTDDQPGRYTAGATKKAKAGDQAGSENATADDTAG